MKSTTNSSISTAQNRPEALEKIISATKAKQKGKGFLGHCPAHDDKHPSLSITLKPDGTILMNCLTGCSQEQVISKLPIEKADLFPKKEAKPDYKFEKAYDYLDESRKLLFQSVRRRLANPHECPGEKLKDFQQRRPSGQGRWIYSLGDVRRILYRVPELIARRSATVFICEGEKDVDRLIELGLLATTNPMGAGKWDDVYNVFLQGREVVILPDNDTAGRDHAQRVAQSLYGQASSIRVIELPNLPERGDVSDWLDAGGNEETLCLMVEAAAEWTPSKFEEQPDDVIEPAESDEWDAPAPLFHYEQPDFPVNALPKWQGGFVESLAEATQTPDDLGALMSLAICSAAVARKVRVRARAGWEEPLNLFVAIALPPANRKSQVVSDVTRPLFDYERELILDTREQVAAEKNEYNILVQELAELQKKCARAEIEDREGLRELANAKARELAARKVPVSPKMIVDDVTAEVLASILAEQQGRIAMFSAEGGIFDTLAGRYSNGTPNIDVLLKGHSGDDLRVDRRDRSEHIEKPALTIGLAIQPEVLRGLIEKPGFRGKGLLGRFLYSLPKSTIGKRKIRPEAMTDNVRQTYQRNVVRLASIEAITNSDGKIEPQMILFSKDADDLLKSFEEEIEPMLGNDGELAFIGDWGGKLAGATVRIAAILHLALHSETLNQRWPGEVSADTLKNAIEIARYLMAHARIAYAEMAADPKIEDAKLVLRWIEKTGSPTFTKRDAYQGTKGRFNKVALLEPALKILEDHGFIQLVEIPPKSGAGRKPSPVFLVNPALSAFSPPTSPR